jgi:uncharacterized protein (TIGR02391 family)
MIEWYVETRRLLRGIAQQARDALELYEQGGKNASAATNAYLKADLQQLMQHWRARYSKESAVFESLARHISFGMGGDYSDILKNDLPPLEERADALLLAGAKEQRFGFEDLLHPTITASSYGLYRDGHLRESVLNAVVALFDHIRARTKCDDDGDRLVGKVFSTEKPLLTLSNLDSESGLNDQKGFMQIFKGVYQGIRNPKAHSLEHDLTPLKAAQYLIFASLLARRIDEAK